MLQSFQARTGQPWGEPLVPSSDVELNAAVAAAALAFGPWSATDGEARARLLDALAVALETGREVLVQTADTETALGLPRLYGELDRTAFQLRRFASLCRQGVPFGCTEDPAVAGPPPAGHPAMVRVRVPLGPVAMFAASNFPFAFSVLGGDTASALAAGCPVVVKAHPGHPHTSQAVFALAQDVVRELGLPAGVLTLVQGDGHELGQALVRHPQVAAAAFTGSTRGGLALWRTAQARPRPIPFFGELGSINPVVALPEVLATQGEALAAALASSVALGCGQFCTNPGVLVLLRNPHSQAFVQRLVTHLQGQQPHAMLTAGMRRALDAGVAAQQAAGARPLLLEPTDALAPRPALAEVDAPRFIAHEALREEVFGPASLVVWCDSLDQVQQVLHAVGGTLTVTLWGVDQDCADHRALVRTAMAVAGRVLFAGVPTGVAVTAAQQHGGPWPSSTEPASTSVGDAALDRFLRPVALQDAPAWLTSR